MIWPAIRPAILRPIKPAIDRYGSSSQMLAISAPEGAYPGAILSVTGGTGPYQFILNGTDFGPTFSLPATIPDDLQMDDALRVRDATGMISNSILIIEYPEIPTAVSRPVVSGYPIANGTLYGTDGTWGGTMLEYSYRWLLNGVEITGQYGNILNMNDSGAVDEDIIVFEVTAFNVAGSAINTSLPVEAVIPPGTIVLKQPEDQIMTQPVETIMFQEL